MEHNISAKKAKKNFKKWAKQHSKPESMSAAERFCSNARNAYALGARINPEIYNRLVTN